MKFPVMGDLRPQQNIPVTDLMTIHGLGLIYGHISPSFHLCRSVTFSVVNNIFTIVCCKISH